jgi:Fe-S oxidoreductase
LIFALMATYLAAFFVTRPAGAVQTLWWTHTITLLAFLPLIPHTKHLHLVLSPFTVFFSRGEFAHIPPLSGDEDFGLVAGRDLTRLVSLQAYSCVECGRCMEHCPANATGKELNPKEIVLGLRGYLNEFGPNSEEPLLGKYNTQEAAFECTTCGACEFQCPVGIEHVPILVGLRRGAVNTGAWENDYGSKLFLALERGSNALGMSTTERDKFVEKHALPLFDGTQEYCLWLGCMGAYDPQGREIVLALVRVMRHLGASFGVLRKEKCTGDPVRRLGNDLLFQQLAEANLEALAQNRVKKIITICPHCVRTIQEDWKEFGAPPEVEHHSEFLARFASQLPSVQNREKIVFHDPCYLGRYRGVYDEPRQVAALAGELVEAPRSHERSFCCGAGGGLAFLGEEKGDRVSHVRAAELAATGAGVVASACPFCNTMLRDALAARGEDAPELLDIAQIAARGLPERNG